ncbi:Aldo-ket-red domain-containing protein [Mycena kentingensis (nom. inval.)]|nr:Aldo-ket-red domain-containing protein [Mycena kentingensis (nom. inval.)]
MTTSAEHPSFDMKNMPFRRLGPSGLRVPLFSIGGWLTLGGSVVGDPVKVSCASVVIDGAELTWTMQEIMRTAFENGINMFDTAEDYQKGESEREIGRVIKELNWRRSDIIISTKIFWSPRSGPNDTGLSRKHVIEGTKDCLQRLQLSYVDVIFAHRCDISVPMEEIVRAFNYVINQGWAFYWGTSEWTAQQIEEAHHVAAKLNLIAPIAEQCKHHMFHRERAEKEYEPLYRKYGLGTTAFSALQGGLLTGKVVLPSALFTANVLIQAQYNDGIPAGTRFDTVKMFKGMTETEAGKEMVKKVREVTKIADGASLSLSLPLSLYSCLLALYELNPMQRAELGTTTTALALAWVAKHTHTSTVILGVTSPAQIVDNLKALEVLPKLTPEVLARIEEVLGNKPVPAPTYGRPALDVHGRF